MRWNEKNTYRKFFERVSGNRRAELQESVDCRFFPSNVSMDILIMFHDQMITCLFFLSLVIQHFIFPCIHITSYFVWKANLKLVIHYLFWSFNIINYNIWRIITLDYFKKWLQIIGAKFVISLIVSNLFS